MSTAKLNLLKLRLKERRHSTLNLHQAAQLSLQVQAAAAQRDQQQQPPSPSPSTPSPQQPLTPAASPSIGSGTAASSPSPTAAATAAAAALTVASGGASVPTIPSPTSASAPSLPSPNAAATSVDAQTNASSTSSSSSSATTAAGITTSPTTTTGTLTVTTAPTTSLDSSPSPSPTNLPSTTSPSPPLAYPSKQYTRKLRPSISQVSAGYGIGLLDTTGGGDAAASTLKEQSPNAETAAAAAAAASYSTAVAAQAIAASREHFWNVEFRFVWDCVLACVSLYHIITIPLRIGEYAHWTNPTQLEYWAIVDYPFDLLCLIDCFLRYRVFFSYLNEGNLMWDAIASIPFDLIAITTGIKSIPFLRLTKLIRLRRFTSFFDTLPDMLEEIIQISPSFWRITRIFCEFSLVAHWSSCVWTYVGQRNLDCPDGLSSCMSLEANWLQFDGKERAEFGTKYVRALYGMLSTLFTIGLADIRPISSIETIVFTIVSMTGAILCARATATFASLFSKFDAPRVAYETRISNLQAYMSGKFLPQELQERVLYYYEYVWKTSKGMDEKKVLESLPAHLRMEALVFLEGDAIRKVPFFNNASSGLINSIALVLQPSLFSPDTYIQVKGQVGYELYLVHKGECGRIQEADGMNIPSSPTAASLSAGQARPKYTVINVLQSGAYFGEMSLFSSSPIEIHKYSIKSFTFLELFKLTRTDFEKVMKLCCNNNESETQIEIDSMYRHQLAHIKSQTKVTKLLGHDFEGSSIMNSEEDVWERQQKEKWYYSHMLPNSRFRVIWNIISYLIVAYWFVALPFRITFMYTPYNMILNRFGQTNTYAEHDNSSFGGTPNHTLTGWLIVDCFCDLFFLVDIVLKARYFSFYRSLEEELNRNRAKNQMNGGNNAGNHEHSDNSVNTSSTTNSSTSPSTEEDEDFSSSDYENEGRSAIRGRMINSRPECVFKRYKRTSHFMYDCISSLPLDYILAATLGWQWWSIPRLIRLFRIHFLKSAHHSIQYWLLTRWKLKPDAYRLLAFFTVYLVLMHWCACSWYGVGLLSTSHDADSWLQHELNPSTELRAPPTTDDSLYLTLILRNYIRSFYFVVVITTTTAGYRDVLAYSIGESIFASFLMLNLALLYYFSLGVISTMLTQITLSEHLFQEKMDTLHTFIKQHISPSAIRDEKAGKVIKASKIYTDGITPKLAQTIRNYYTYLWFRQRGCKEEEILSELPTALREEVAIALNYDVLTQSMTLFNGCSPALLKSILSKFKYQIYLPNEYLCRANDVANEMFILNRGKAVVVSPNETITYELLNRNTCYGEALFLMQLRRKASVKTIKFCDVSMLTTVDFQNTISAFPVERQKIFENSVAVRKRQVRNDHSMAVNRKLAKVKQVMAMSFTPTVSKYRTFSPQSIFVRNWEMLLLLLALYHCILIPLRIAFVDVTRVEIFYMEYVLDLLFYIDIYLNYHRFSYIKHNGHLEKDPSLIATHYKEGGKMIIDCLAVMPLDLITLCVSGGRGNYLELMAYLRLPRVLRFIRIPEYFKRMRQFVQDADLGIEVNYIRLMELGVACMLFAHWLGCGFFWIARLQGGVGEHPATLTWLYAYGITDASFTTQYLASLYWALSTITVVCYGDVIPVSIWEHVYVIVVAVVCFFLVAALIGNIASLITHLDAAAAILTTKLNRFDEYARRHGLPELLQYRVHQYWIHLHKIQQGVDEEALLNDMPRSLRTAVSTSRYLKYIQHQPYFSFCEPNLLHQLTEALKLEVFIPGDMIMCEGDLGRKFYIVKKGQVQIVKGGGNSNSSHGNDDQTRDKKRLAFGGHGHGTNPHDTTNTSGGATGGGGGGGGRHTRNASKDIQSRRGSASTNQQPSFLNLDQLALQFKRNSINANGGGVKGHNGSALSSDDEGTAAEGGSRRPSILQIGSGPSSQRGSLLIHPSGVGGGGIAGIGGRQTRPGQKQNGLGIGGTVIPTAATSRANGIEMFALRGGGSNGAGGRGNNLFPPIGSHMRRLSHSSKSPSARGSFSTSSILRVPGVDSAGNISVTNTNPIMQTTPQHQPSTSTASGIDGLQDEGVGGGAHQHHHQGSNNNSSDNTIPLEGQDDPRSSSFSLRDILGAASMLDHSAFAQDGIVLSNAQGSFGVSIPLTPTGVGVTMHETAAAAMNGNGSSSAKGLAESPKNKKLHPGHMTAPSIDFNSGPPAAATSAGASAVASGQQSSTSQSSSSSSTSRPQAKEAPVILQLDEGSMLGELSFFLPLRRTASIYATTFCTFLVLDRKQFNEIMSTLPHYVAKMRELARASVEGQAMNHANIRRNFTNHSKKLRQMCLVAADTQTKKKWGPEFQARLSQRRTETRHTAWLPGSNFVQLWKLLILSILLYYLYVIPFRICYFDAFPSMDSSWLVFDYLLDLVFITDMYFNLQRFGFIDETLGIGITNPQEISKRYRNKTRFKIDIVALLPIDLFALCWSGGSGEDGGTNSLGANRDRFHALLILRLSKILRLFQVFELMRGLGPLENKVIRTLGKIGVTITEGGVRFLKMLQIFLLIAHWIGCLWFIVGYRSSLNLAENYAANLSAHAITPIAGGAHAEQAVISWLQQDKILDIPLLQTEGRIHLTASGTRIYIRSVYYAVKSLCTLGMADLTTTGSNTSEMIFAILVIIVSAVVLAAFVATFETTFHAMDEDIAKFHRQMEYNRSYMKTKKLPSGLQDRINLYYSYIWNRSKGLDESHALSNLSTQLRMDVMMFINHDIIEKVSLFRDCEIGFIKSIAVVLQAAVFMPDDIIIRAGTITNQMYFIKDGEILMERHGVLIVELGAGDFFNESAMINAKSSTANYIAQSFCDMFTLTRHHYEQVIEYYPKYRQLLIWKMNAINAQKRRDVQKSIGNGERMMTFIGNVAEPTMTREGSQLYSNIHKEYNIHGQHVGKEESRIKSFASPGGISGHHRRKPSGSISKIELVRRGSVQQYRTEAQQKQINALANRRSSFDATIARNSAAGVLQPKQQKDGAASPLSTSPPQSSSPSPPQSPTNTTAGAAVDPMTATTTATPMKTNTTSPVTPALAPSKLTITTTATATASTLSPPGPRNPVSSASSSSTAASSSASAPVRSDLKLLVPSFRMNIGEDRTLPSPNSYKSSMVELEEFKEALSDPAQATSQAKKASSRRTTLEKSLAALQASNANNGAASSSSTIITFPSNLPTGPSGIKSKVGSKNVSHHGSRLGSKRNTNEKFQTPPTLKLSSIIFTPMPKSIPPTPDASSHGDPLRPADSPSPPQDESPPADTPKHSGFSPPDSAKVAATRPHLERQPSWPPKDVEIDDNIQEQLARMNYVGLTDEQKEADGRRSAAGGLLSTPTLPAGFTPLTPVRGRHHHTHSDVGLIQWTNILSGEISLSPMVENRRIGGLEDLKSTKQRSKYDSALEPELKLDISGANGDANEHDHEVARVNDIVIDIDMVNGGNGGAGTVSALSTVPEHKQNEGASPTPPSHSVPALLDMPTSSSPTYDASGSDGGGGSDNDAARSSNDEGSDEDEVRRRTRLRPPQRPRSRSHDVTNMGAENDLQRLLTNTARRVAQHMRKPSVLPHHLHQLSRDRSSSMMSGVAPGPSSSSSYHAAGLRLPGFDPGVRRHSFNVGIFNTKPEEPTEPMFKSVFDF